MTLEDFKNFGAYDAVIVSSHGNANADGTSQIVATGRPYTDAYRGDWDAHRFAKGTDGEVLLLSQWFDTYTNQVSSCRGSGRSGQRRLRAEIKREVRSVVSQRRATTRGCSAFRRCHWSHTHNGCVCVGTLRPHVGMAGSPSRVNFPGKYSATWVLPHINRGTFMLDHCILWLQLPLLQSHTSRVCAACAPLHTA